jgi:hypothetical protein
MRLSDGFIVWPALTPYCNGGNEVHASLPKTGPIRRLKLLKIGTAFALNNAVRFVIYRARHGRPQRKGDRHPARFFWRNDRAAFRDGIIIQRAISHERRSASQELYIAISIEPSLGA